MFLLRRLRDTGRSQSTIVLIFTTIISLLLSLHLYRKDRQRNAIIYRQPFGSIDQTILSDKIKTSPFAQYASDEHLHSLLRKQANAQKQVIITIIGGDSYSLFAWDWYERMHEISNRTKKCHCFIVAMDETAVVLAIKQNIPVYYSTFTFEQQIKWINVIEARQHSLYRVGHAKFNTAAKIVQLGYSVFLSEMDVFW